MRALCVGAGTGNEREEKRARREAGAKQRRCSGDDVDDGRIIHSDAQRALCVCVRDREMR